nr:alanine racemase [Asticcacaulis aquaticus]
METVSDTATRLALSEGRAGLLTIDLGALVWNYDRLRQVAEGARVAAVVKADAYGLGAERVAGTLYDAGCRDFFVALTTEAVALRPNLPSDARLYVLNGLLPGAEALAVTHDLIPVLNSPEQVARWSATAQQTGRTLKAVAQVDTGMSRLGMQPDQLRTLAAEPQRLEGIDLTHLMSHLACADEPQHPANADQFRIMTEMSALFPHLPVSFANSGGAFLGQSYHKALVRPGIALYGGAPSTDGNPMRPVVTLEVAVIQTREVLAGTRIGYGGTVVADQPLRLATLLAGYADGLPRALSHHAGVWWQGVRLPFIGRVSMDSIIIDISALPQGALNPGDFVELIGPNQSIDDLAADAGTISYEILTALGSRYYRHYVEA